jgi:hypothetical protein
MSTGNVGDAVASLLRVPAPSGVQVARGPCANAESLGRCGFSRQTKVDCFEHPIEEPLLFRIRYLAAERQAERPPPGLAELRNMQSYEPGGIG